MFLKTHYDLHLIDLQNNRLKTYHNLQNEMSLISSLRSYDNISDVISAYVNRSIPAFYYSRSSPRTIELSVEVSR